MRKLERIARSFRTLNKDYFVSLFASSFDTYSRSIMMKLEPNFSLKNLYRVYAIEIFQAKIGFFLCVILFARSYLTQTCRLKIIFVITAKKENSGTILAWNISSSSRYAIIFLWETLFKKFFGNAPLLKV